MLKPLLRRLGFVFLNVALTLVVAGLIVGSIAKAQPSCSTVICPTTPPGYPETCCNGDINGDAGIDIADPIALLSYLFSSGPAPAAIASGPSTTNLTHLTATLSGSIAVGVPPVVVPWDQEDGDDFGEFSGGAFTPIESGLYLVQVQLGFTNVPDTIVELGADIRVNGLAAAQDRRYPDQVLSQQSASVSKVVELAAGDVLEAAAVASILGGGTVTLNSGPVITYLQVTRLR